MTTYKIRIVTGTVKNAGTDAEVYITVVGTNGSKTWKNLNDTDDYDDFEKGDVNVIKVTSSTDLGDIKKITIGHDNSGWGAGWYLKNVQITNTTSGKQWFFEANRWLAKDEGDKKIKVTLTPSGVSSATPANPNTQENLLKKIDEWYNRRTSSAWTGISKKKIADGLNRIVELYFGSTEKYTKFRDCSSSKKTDYYTGIDQGSGFSICGPVAIMFYLAKLNMSSFIDVVTTLYEYGTLKDYRVPEKLRTLKDNNNAENLYECKEDVVASVCWMFQASMAQKEAVGDVDFKSTFWTLHTRPGEMIDDVEFMFNAKNVKEQSWGSISTTMRNIEDWPDYLKKSGAFFWCIHSTALKNIRDEKNKDYSSSDLNDLHWVVVLRAEKFSNGVIVDLHSWGKIYRIVVNFETLKKMSYSAILF